MLYTSYINKIKTLPEDTKKILIIRFLPKYFQNNGFKKYKNTYHVPELSPSESLLKKYKEDNDWEEYIELFNNEMNERIDMKDMLQRALRSLKNGEDLIFICYEKDPLFCHRSLLAKWFENQGIKCKEI